MYADWRHSQILAEGTSRVAPTCRTLLPRHFGLDLAPIKNVLQGPLTTVVNLDQTMTMSSNTMSFALPESMRAYIDERVQSGQYGNTSEYLRDLIRQDQENESRQRLRSLIAAGLESGEARSFDETVHAELRSRSLSDSE